MGSLVAFFHKHMDIQERKFKATNRMSEAKARARRAMRKEVRRIQRVARRYWWPCDKCGELFKEKELEQITIAEGVNERFCKTCMDMMKLARDDY